MGIPPSGKRVEVSGISIYRVADGKVTDEWTHSAELGMLQQLGVLEMPGQ